MHVLIIPSWYPNTYNELYGIYVKEQAEALAKFGIKVGVISIEEINLLQILKNKKLEFFSNFDVENDVPTYSIQYPVPPKMHSLRRAYKKSRFKKIFDKYVREQGLPDVVHLHTFIVGELALWIKETYGIHYMVTEHFTGFSRGIISNQNMKFAKKVYNESSCNIAVSNEFKVLLEKQTNQHFVYIPNVVDTDFFTIGNRINRKNFIFINVAFLDKKKNHRMLIKAFHRAFKNKCNIKLVIVGDGPEYFNLKRLIGKLNMADQVQLHGSASRTEVKELMQNADTFVLSSRYETFGVVLIEAMSCGLPVLATKCGGPESIIKNKSLGILTEIDEKLLSLHLGYMVNNIEKYDSALIRKYIEDNFSEQAVIPKIKKLYFAIAKNKSDK